MNSINKGQRIWPTTAPKELTMRKSIRFTGIALLSAALLAAGPASARDYDRGHGRYHGGGHGGGGGGGVALAIGALAGLAIGAAVLSSSAAVAAPAPVYAAPPQGVTYVEQGYSSYEQPYQQQYQQPYQQPYQQQAQPYAQVPPGYCYRASDRAYVPCAQPAQVNYYGY
ncbi:mechanosensitive ion channel protein MscS [Cupriavidus pampae]|nr:mechanosensitive ion channel protein MscS [Cupriavidus pampae]